MKLNICVFILSICFCSCSVSKQIEKSATKAVLDDPLLKSAHVGISIFEPATGKYWFDHDGDKYFIPASNCKIPTCYAAMKYLGDSLVGIRYKRLGPWLFIKPSGDPTFLHPDFSFQPVLDLIKTTGTDINIFLNHTEAIGNGWSWNDYDQDYMAERSTLPVYGNLVWISKNPIYPKDIKRDTLMDTAKMIGNKILWIKPKYFAQDVYLDVNHAYQRRISENKFYVDTGIRSIKIPFVTDQTHTVGDILHSITGKKISYGAAFLEDTILHSQPTDSLLKPMMHNSDNFFAEQSLLMVSNERLGIMNDAKIIDTILKTDFKDLPQRLRWVDGSGLSRFDLFTPQDLIFILNKMRTEFGMERIKNIFATGDEGTLEGLYKTEQGYIYAKTGTLSGVLALSGFLYTKKNKLLIFSIMINNHQSSASQIRRVMERFVRSVREKY